MQLRQLWMWLAKAFHCGDAALVAALTNSPNGEPRSGLAKMLPLLGGEGWGEGELFLQLNLSGLAFTKFLSCDINRTR